VHAHPYRITIEGVLGSVSCQAFEGFNIASNDGRTSLIADLDQAALYGVLIRIQSRTGWTWPAHGLGAGVRW
jgi:hypothetical protein